MQAPGKEQRIGDGLIQEIGSHFGSKSFPLDGFRK
jgi:hypothetical protein